MRTSLRAALAVLALATPAVAPACGVCDEDRVAAVFDKASMDAALAHRRFVAFFAVDGSLPATQESRRALVEALYAAGASRGTARVSLESASVSVAFDPARTTVAGLGERAGRRLAAKGLALTPLRVIDSAGVPRHP